MVIIKNEKEIIGIRKSCKIVGEILNTIGNEIKIGMSTKDIESIAVRIINSHNAISAFYHYGDNPPYPGHVCVSVNDEVVHGIPGKRIIENGDIVSVDVGVVLGGFYGDAARTYAIGVISDDARELMEVTRNALDAAIAVCREGNTVRDISRAVYDVAKNSGKGVVRDLVGHGVGIELHEDPQIPNFVDSGPTTRLRAGMTIAIEPMFTNGDWRITTDKDGWTIRTHDNSLSAHFENTVLIQKDGCEILTRV